ncbi:unnamed protein product [Oikopleura dioica]|uniref:Uncharacterized protein n=1 Tax=Oikopleura dioica TaxID=34765 RepID=E4Y5L3_OIKDI|nr:unnamed protein product [Oikopleura dioica]
MRLLPYFTFFSGILGQALSIENEERSLVRRAAKGQADLASFERGRRRKKAKRGKKKKKLGPQSQRWSALSKLVQQFANKNVKSKKKKITNLINKINSKAKSSLPLPGQRSNQCIKFNETARYEKKQSQQMKRNSRAQKRSERRISQSERKASRLFNDDIQEASRKRRETDEYDEEYEYADYDSTYEDYILYGEHTSDYDDEFGAKHPDESKDGVIASSLNVRGRRGKKKGKLGPKRIWFNMLQGARGFILSDMKYCANQRALLKRIDGLEKKVKINAPILNQPPPKCKGRKCKKKGKSG